MPALPPDGHEDVTYRAVVLKVGGTLRTTAGGGAMSKTEKDKKNVLLYKQFFLKTHSFLSNTFLHVQ